MTRRPDRLSWISNGEEAEEKGTDGRVSFLSVMGATRGFRDRGAVERGVRPGDGTTAGGRTGQALRIKDQVNSNKDQGKTNKS